VPAFLLGAPAITFDNMEAFGLPPLATGIRSSSDIRRVSIHRRLKGRLHAVPNSEVEVVTPKEWYDRRYVHACCRSEGMYGFWHSGGLDQFRQSLVVSVPLQPISYRVLCRFHRCTLCNKPRWRTADKGALGCGIGPKFC